MRFLERRLLFLAFVFPLPSRARLIIVAPSVFQVQVDAQTPFWILIIILLLHNPSIASLFVPTGSNAYFNLCLDLLDIFYPEMIEARI